MGAKDCRPSLVAACQPSGRAPAVGGERLRTGAAGCTAGLSARVPRSRMTANSRTWADIRDVTTFGICGRGHQGDHAVRGWTPSNVRRPKECARCRACSQAAARLCPRYSRSESRHTERIKPRQQAAVCRYHRYVVTAFRVAAACDVTISSSAQPGAWTVVTPSVSLSGPARQPGPSLRAPTQSGRTIGPRS